MFNGCARRRLKDATAFGCEPLPRWRTSGTQPSGTPAKAPVGEFGVGPGDLLGGVSLRGRGLGRVGVDERVEGASERPPGPILLDVDQVGQTTLVSPLVEPHRGAAIFAGFVQATDEVDGVQTVSPVAASSIDYHGDRLVHPCSSARRSGRNGGGVPRPNPAVTQNLTSQPSAVVKHRRMFS